MSKCWFRSFAGGAAGEGILMRSFLPGQCSNVQQPLSLCPLRRPESLLPQLVENGVYTFAMNMHHRTLCFHRCRRVEVEDFMCHAKCAIDLNPKLTFITGRNGSGKSAIAAAICMAFGATPNKLGRGSRQSDVIRHGCEQAVIRVTINNEGETRLAMRHAWPVADSGLIKAQMSCLACRRRQGFHA